MTNGRRDGLDASNKPTESMGEEAPGSRRRQLAVGDCLGGRFTIIRFLARGGMGEVYEAADEYLQGQHCALKTLRPEIAADPMVKQRFEREVIGDCYAMLGDSARVQESYTKAAQILSESLRTNPRRGRAWMTLAFCEAKIGKRIEAEAAIRNAEEKGARDAKSQPEKAEVLTLLGRKDEAVELVLDCLRKGISKVEVELALDLAEVRVDPRYRNYVAH